MTEPTKEDLRILVYVKDESSYSFSGATLKLEAVFVYDTPEGIRNPSSSGFDRSPYADLTFTGFLDELSASRSGDFYTRDLEYRSVYSVDLPAAELMVKTLRSVYKKIEATRARFGRPADSAAYLAMLANAVGIKTVAPFGRKWGDRQGSLYRDNDYRWMDTDGLRSWLNMQIADFVKTHNVVKEEE